MVEQPFIRCEHLPALSESSNISVEGIERLVGRETELELLQQALTDARNGRRQLLFLTGESGIGKTTLLETFLAECVRGEEVWVAVGQCVQHYGKGEAYLPLIDAIGDLVKESPHLIEYLRRDAPSWLAQMPALIDGEESDILRRRLQGVSRERMIRELAVALERLSDDKCLILVLEDLHWSDVSTIDWLSNMARRRTKSRMLLLCTSRVSEIRVSNHPLKNLMSELRPRRLCLEIPLEPLDEQSITSYLKARYQRDRVEKEIAAGILKRTGGNPLFMVLLVDYLHEQGGLLSHEGRLSTGDDRELVDRGVPENLRRLVGDQISRLRADEIHVLEVGSVSGFEFSCSTVAAGTGLAEEMVEQRCQDMAGNLQFIEEAGVETFPDGRISGKYRFRHVLYQDIIYYRMSAGRRARMHRNIGAASKGSVWAEC